MPFFKKIETNVGTIALWKLQELSEELSGKCKLTNEETHRLESISFEPRRQEFLATRILLQQLLGENTTISYTEAGKPYLKNLDQNISISHSKNFACLFLSEKEVGVDIERTDRRIEKISKRFLHFNEKEFIESLPDQQFAMILYWAAKEAIFKCSPSQGIQFNEQIFISPFDIENDTQFKGQLLISAKKINYNLQFFSFENNVLVSCVEE